jgi:hypothetical protein
MSRKSVKNTENRLSCPNLSSEVITSWTSAFLASRESFSLINNTTAPLAKFLASRGNKIQKSDHVRLHKQASTRASRCWQPGLQFQLQHSWPVQLWPFGSYPPTNRTRLGQHDTQLRPRFQ